MQKYERLQQAALELATAFQSDKLTEVDNTYDPNADDHDSESAPDQDATADEPVLHLASMVETRLPHARSEGALAEKVIFSCSTTSWLIMPALLIRHVHLIR